MKSDPKPVAVTAATTPATAASEVPAATATTGAATTTSSTLVASFRPVGFVAGVPLPGVVAPRAGKGQLSSLTLFNVRDPFVQQASDGTSSSVTSLPPVAVAVTPAPVRQTPRATPVKQLPIAYATVMLNGKPQQLQVNQKFPKAAPLFVLQALTKKQATLGVVRGAFGGGKTVTLALGKSLTLVNAATGARFRLRLVYTGGVPERIERFAAGAEKTAKR
jgi:hypothetical protein